MKHRRPERAAEQRLLAERVKPFLEKYPICPVMLFFKDVKIKTVQAHHTKRNIGDLLLDESFWLPISLQGHVLCEQTAPMQCRMMGFNLSRGRGINDELELKVLEKRRNLDFSEVPEYNLLMSQIYPEYIKL